MKKFRYLILCGLSLFLTSCASVPMASTAEDTAAKQFGSTTSKANVYVYRGAGVGTALLVQIIMDGRITGSLAPNTYQKLALSPGSHTISTGGAFGNVASATLHAQGGRNYFYKTGPTMGLVMPRVKLEQVDEQTGRAAVMKLKRAAASSY